MNSTKKILYPIILLMSLLALTACVKNESTTTDKANIFCIRSVNRSNCENKGI